MVAVTRAANLTIGAAVAVALPGARVNGREIEPAEVDGVVSEAYLGRAADLGLAQLFPAAGPADALVLGEPGVTAGSPLADAVWWRDVVLEVDNLSLTNRPTCGSPRCGARVLGDTRAAAGRAGARDEGAASRAEVRAGRYH